MPPAGGGPILLAKGLTRTIHRVEALAGADLAVREREIHGLLGAGGAGKSTLARIIAGHDVYDGGTVTYRSYEVRLKSPREALRVGIALVGQDASLVPDLSVLDNIVLPQYGRPGRLDEAALKQQALSLLSSFGQADAMPLDSDVRRLSVAQRQIVQIARAIGVRARILIFDEPTAALSRGDTDRLFDIMTRLRRAGCAVVVTARRPDDILGLADRVSVLRAGRTVLDACPVGDLDEEAVREAMGCTAATPAAPRRAATEAPLVLDVQALAAPPGVAEVSFQLRGGDVLGLSGLVGAGRAALLQAIAGLSPRRGGHILCGGVTLEPSDPAGAIRAGIGHVAADRHGGTMFPGLSVRENLMMAHLGAHRGFGHGFGRRDAALEGLLRRVDLPAAVLDADVGDLTSFARRKLALARALLPAPSAVLLDEPVQGLDPAMRRDFVAILRTIAATGVAMVVGADDDDLMALSDRVVVIRDGWSVADIPAAMLDEATLAILGTPRAAMQRNAALLRALTHDNGGASFWALIDDTRVICLDAVVEDAAADPGFAAGQALRLDATAIPEALRRRAAAFVHDAAADRATMLVPIGSSRGHPLGWVGLSLAASTSLPPAAAIRHRIDMLATTL